MFGKAFSFLFLFVFVCFFTLFRVQLEHVFGFDWLMFGFKYGNITLEGAEEPGIFFMRNLLVQIRYIPNLHPNRPNFFWMARILRPRKRRESA